MNKAPSERIVVTGMGAVTPLGNSVDLFWDGLSQGRSGLARPTLFDADEFPCQVAAEVKDFAPEDWMDVKEAKRRDRYSQFAIAAAKMAWEDADFAEGSYHRDRAGCVIASGIGGIDTIEKQTGRMHAGGARRISPFFVPMLLTNMASGLVAIELGLRGPNYAIVSACASATQGIADALRMLRAGEVEVMVAGGAEASVCRLGFGGFCSMKAMSTKYNDNPTTASRPFDAGRDGFVMGEGAGVLVLETLAHAEARGAKIYAEILGHGHSCDAYHMTAPDDDGSGLALCLEATLRDAGLETEQVDYINAHGTSTPLNDKGETLAIKKVFGDHAYEMALSSTKSMTGHLLGAA
ncbi:MAG: beta-ketoacyl-ACP synthase II, partial [Pseudomonadota bacterium]